MAIKNRTSRANTHTSSKRFLIAIVILAIAVLAGLYYYRMVSESFTSNTVVTYYFLPGCPHCDDFKPEWDKFVAAVKTQKLPIDTTSVDGSKGNDAGIKGFPTVLITKDGNTTTYSGDRTSDALIKYVQQG